MLQRHLENVGESLCAGVEIWTVEDIVLRVDIGAFVNQHAGDVDEIAMCGFHQCGVAVPINRVDMRAFPQEMIDLFEITVRGGDNQPLIEFGCAIGQSHAPLSKTGDKKNRNQCENEL